jgi:hypothetical protein
MLAQTVTKRKLVQDPAVLPTGGGNDGVTIRRSAPGDGPAISRLGRLEARRPERGPYVLAERGGEVFAAAPLSGGTPLADPFIRTADVVAMLQLRAAQLSAP